MSLSFNPLAAWQNRNRIRVPTWLYLTSIGVLVTVSFGMVLLACIRIGLIA